MKIPPYTQNKHWGFIHSFNRSKKRPQVYLISNSSAHWVDIDNIVPVTVEQVIRYMRTQYGFSAKRTRFAIEEGRKRLNW